MTAGFVEVSAPPQDVPQKRSMCLELGGQSLTVLSDSEESHVRDVVAFVNRKLDDARESARRAQPDQIALLALLNVAEELFREKQNGSALRRRVRERSLRLLGAIDEVERAVDASADELPAEVREGISGKLGLAYEGGR